MGSRPRIVNSSLNLDLGQRLELKRLKKLGTFNPKHFNARVFKIRKHNATALIFASGKVTLVGCKSEKNIVLAIIYICKQLEKYGYFCKPLKIIVNFFVCVSKCNFQISLENLSCSLKHCSLEPELFSGLIYSHPTTKIRLMVFRSGKLYLTGAKSISFAKACIKKFISLIKDATM
jgi:transcription initiation factor TFIID TATA-box-binding protein